MSYELKALEKGFEKIYTELEKQNINKEKIRKSLSAMEEVENNIKRYYRKMLAEEKINSQLKTFYSDRLLEAETYANYLQEENAILKDKLFKDKKNNVYISYWEAQQLARFSEGLTPEMFNEAGWMAIQDLKDKIDKLCNGACESAN